MLSGFSTRSGSAGDEVMSLVLRKTSTDYTVSQLGIGTMASRHTAAQLIDDICTAVFFFHG